VPEPDRMRKTPALAPASRVEPWPKRHPQWCDGYGDCTDLDTSAVHYGARCSWLVDTADECEVALELVRSDELAPWLPGPIVGDARVRLSLLSAPCGYNAYNEVDLDASECRRLAAKLLAKAELLAEG
jgi:hypothetical protein